MALSEVDKLQQHLALLKQEYAKLQDRYNEIVGKYSVLASTTGTNDNSFASCLLKLVAGLYNSEVYSDIKIKLSDRAINAHKLVLNARSEKWNRELLLDREQLDWSEMNVDVAEAILQWIYTNKIKLNSDDVTLKVMHMAHEFKLFDLLLTCEQALISNVTVRTCVRFYSVAEEINANNLREYCSSLISTHWDDLNASDFEHMSGPLLYNMLKSKTQLPLHSAVRLQREDVVFLCLVENSSRLSDIVNIWGPTSDLPLDLALRANNSSIASTLVQHNADINIRDSQGETLLHRAIKRDDAFSALFLLDNNCDATLTTRTGNDSALHLLAGSNDITDLRLAEKLINKNVGVNSQNRQGLTALHIAIMANNETLFALLLNQPNIDINLKSIEEHSALYYALLKYEAGDNEENSYVSQLLQKKDIQPNPVYSQTGNNLLQILIQAEAKTAALFLCDYLQNLNHVNLEGETAMHTACIKKCNEVCGKLLSLGANPNAVTNELRQTPLHYAVLSNSEECINEFIEFNRESVNFNLKDSNGETPLSLALNEGFNELVPILIKGKADVNMRNAKDFTLLHQAILKEDSKTAIFLLDNGADMNAKTSEFESPLQLAIHCRLGDVVDALCLRGVDMSALDRVGNCPLWAALDSGQENIAAILARHGVDTDCWGPGPEGCQQTLLHRAIDDNKEAIAIFLIQAGCDLDSPRMPGPSGEGGDEAKDKASPLHLCCQWGLDTVVRALIEHEANINCFDADRKTPLHVAIENQHSEIISLLLQVPNIDLSLRDKSGLSPFAAALTYRNNKAAKAILERLPSAAEQFDAKGYNFLHTAIKKNDLESFLFLLSIHIDVNSRIQDSTLTPPLHLAAQYGDETVVRSLILAGARVEDLDAHKQTALHVASEANNASVIAALIQNHIDYNACNNNGDNALHIAVREGHLNVVKALLTESQIDAEHVNLKGRNPLHELCRCGKENAAAICEFFLECMPDYPINRPDIDGNTPLLLAYMKGNGNLCRVLVKANACLAAENNDRVTIFNYQVATKQLLHKLLDQLSQQVPWTQTDMCQECGKNFSITVRKHHCRHCGRILCSKCSDQEVPIIKFGENKPVRVCKICFDVLRLSGS
ncbi:hypothetical protein RN001_010909 [Aquatica leii]|uniref:Ankyrin repeat and FYVE domain-containing protein 1 n=1 Tax=Aquatica leii TaxID=1421715 RepID=A0AAN7QHT7_9COLE|nr:hypothetical protein RN001_010909 [Aquatica leii]